jgi:hypothetical protein
MTLHTLVENLPQNSLTTRLLGGLDYLVPGEWRNITLFEDMIKDVTGEDDSGLIQQVGERAIALYSDNEQGYQRAVGIFQGVDHTSTAAGLVSIASLFTDLAPKADTTQAIDAGVKLAAELAAFCLTNGIPGDSISDFANSIVDYGKEERMRMTAWLAFDCIVPLGPDFLAKIMDSIQSLDLDSLQNHKVFRFVADHLPGDIAQKKAVVEQNIQTAGDKLQGFANERGMTQDSLLGKVREYVDIADDKLDLVAAALDMTTNTFEHTGIQTVARRIVSRAYGEI